MDPLETTDDGRIIGRDVTRAELIAAQFGDDGQCWEADGVDLETSCEEHCEWHYRDGTSTRYEFADGSAIVDAGGGWDIGVRGQRLDCVCWPASIAPEGPHADGCPEALRSSR